MERESFQSRLGFLLVSAGCAIGIGNVWRFPYICGEYGGGLFVLIYLLFLLIMGVPVLAMELSVGRASQKSAYLGFKKLEPEGTKWHIHGLTSIVGNYILMMFYTVVSGWMLDYFFKFIRGEFTPGMSTEQIGNVFGNMLADPVELVFWMLLEVALCFIILSAGIQSGLEKVTKIMMGALLILIIVLGLHSLVLPGGMEGLSFLLLPSLDGVHQHGWWTVISAAMNQAFFTLSVGMGSMEIFGSYIDKHHSLPGESVRIAALDTIVAIMAGMIIFPACFAYGLRPDAGPSLLFVTLPNVFMDMTGGLIWGALFFLFMTFASFSTVLAVCENIISFCMDTFKWGRKKAAIINGFMVGLLSIPCALGFNVWENLTIIGNRGVLDTEDFLVSNLILPIGSLIFLLFCVTKYGWGFKNFFEEVNTGDGMKFPTWVKGYFQWILPIMLFVIIVQGLIQ